MNPRALCLLVASLVLAGCASPEGGAGGTTEGAEGAWSFTAFDGETHGPTAEGANATVLFFMATWCGTCMSKAPVLAQAHDAFADDGVRFLSIDFDPSESQTAVDAWKARHGHEWPHGLDADREVQRALDVTIQSTVVVLDADGNEVERFGYGKVTEAGLRAAVERALAA